MASIANLLWLKAHLTLGYYRRSVWRVIGLAITGGIALFVSFFGYFCLLVLFRALEPDTARSILHLLFFFLYFSWVVLPLLGLRLNESFDLSKLLAYPITPRQMFVGTTLANFLDLSVLALLPALLAVPLGFGRTAGQALLIAALVLAFLLHAISLTQTLMLMLWGVMRSRRVKDLAVLLGSVIGMAFWAGQQMLFHHSGGFNPIVFLNLGQSAVLRWLPSGLAAEGVVAAADGRTLQALAYLAALLALSAGAMCVAGSLVARIYSGEMEMGPARAMRRVAPGGRQARIRRPAPGLGLRLPPEVAAVAAKEWRYFARDPRLKTQLFQTTVFMVALPLISLRGAASNGGASLAHTPVPFIATATLFLVSCLTLSGNQFAADGAGLNLLFLFSCPRRRLLQGKNLVLFFLLTGINLGVTLLMIAVTRLPGVGLLAMVGMEASLLVMLGAGNFLSIYFPYRMRGRGENPMAGAPGQGCLTLMLRPFLHLVVLIAAAPVVIATVLPLALGRPGWYGLSLPLALVYGAGAYYALLGRAERALLNREPEIIKACVREPA